MNYELRYLELIGMASLANKLKNMDGPEVLNGAEALERSIIDLEYKLQQLKKERAEYVKAVRWHFG